MKTSFIPAYIITAILLFSCEKNVLNKQPLGQIDNDIVFKDVSLATLYVNNMYLGLPGGLNRGLDCATEIGEDGHAWAPSTSWNTGDISPSNAPFSNEWASMYSQIRNANLVIQNAPNLMGDPDIIAQIKGQSFFLRAYFYTELLNLFGGVPIITTPQSLTDSLMVARNSYQECVDFIVSDLDSAAILLPAEWDASNVGRATQGAALSLKSRLLLFAASPLNNPSDDPSKWQSALDAAKAVIDLDQYSLYPDYYDLFHTDNNQEVIFDIQYAYPTRVENITYRTSPAGMNGAYGMSRPTEDLVERYEMNNGKKITDPGSGYQLQDPYTNRDPRFYATVLYNGASWRGQTLEMFTDGANGPGIYDQYGSGAYMTGYYNKKFITENTILDYTVDKSSDNWILIRYAEILLNYAEAQLHLGNETEARTYLNMVRDRAGMPAIPDSETGAALMNRFANERTVELAFEELHFFDVRRWKTAPDLVAADTHKMMITKNSNGSFTYDVQVMGPRAWQDSYYHVPIPQDEINKNPNLKQNPGY